ncbi:PREDICTED: uncharacterized protein LOC104806162 [Tarenaya hassleriana]|uniref:uncharacterized protein LOC104806162 n=1 Tax=Tarenaya hassleriana TaxID=28532 RepID=UPI00053C1019|nr:PREDICTED: uncharacterized protein LOC104806162 [Tarenaya hassleriana]
MDRNGVSLLLISILFLSHGSLFGDSRVLVDEQAPKDNSTSIQNSPSPRPLPDADSLSNPRPIGDEKSNNVKPKESHTPNSNSSSSDPNESHRLDFASPPPQIQPGDDKKVSNRTEQTITPPTNQTDSKDSEKRSDKKTEPLSPPPSAPPPPKSPESGKNGEGSISGSPPPEKVPHEANSETCNGISNICRDDKSLVACTLSFQRDSAKWSILVQNEGEESLKAKIVLPGSVKNPLRELTVQKHQSQRVNVSISGDTNKIVLDAGHGECVLHTDPLAQSGESTMFIHLPSYEKLVTPINGAYFLIFSVLVFGGTWACCSFCKKRRAGGGVPYQELEMSGGSGLEAQSGGHDVETADWDESWDDDWDEGNAVKSPGGARNLSISGNGLTARGSNRDGWENDWDD